jgi:hypothetical protein
VARSSNGFGMRVLRKLRTKIYSVLVGTTTFVGVIDAATPEYFFLNRFGRVDMLLSLPSSCSSVFLRSP